MRYRVSHHLFGRAAAGGCVIEAPDAETAVRRVSQRQWPAESPRADCCVLANPALGTRDFDDAWYAEPEAGFGPHPTPA